MLLFFHSSEIWDFAARFGLCGRDNVPRSRTDVDAHCQGFLACPLHLAPALGGRHTGPGAPGPTAPPPSHSWCCDLPPAHMFAFSSPYPREWPWEVAFDANWGQVVATPPMTEASLLIPPPHKVGLSLTSPLPCRLPPADHSRKEQPSSMRIRAPGCSRGDLEGCGLGSDRRAQGL